MCVLYCIAQMSTGTNANVDENAKRKDVTQYSTNTAGEPIVSHRSNQVKTSSSHIQVFLSVFLCGRATVSHFGIFFL